MKKNFNISGFSIIEVMISIFIFAMWMASIFMVINSSININNLNKNQIIASNLSREAIEIIRNIRDSNYETYHKYNWIPNLSNDYTNLFSTWTYYKIENDFSSDDFPFILKKDWNQTFTNNPKSDFENWNFDNYKLYLDNNNHYTYKSIWNKKTIFYRYLKIEELKNGSWSLIFDAMKIKSKVIWYSKWYHEFEINTILADFNRL